MNITTHIGLHLAFTPLRSDELAKMYATGYLQALPWGTGDGIKWRAAQAREEWPDADVAEVRVELVGGRRDFTWDEFVAWATGEGEEG